MLSCMVHGRVLNTKSCLLCIYLIFILIINYILLLLFYV